MDFETFRSQALSRGFSEVMVRNWAPNESVPIHKHPFEVDALVVEGEMWLTCDGATRHLLPGDTFQLARDADHSERYGAHNTTFWVARKH